MNRMADPMLQDVTVTLSEDTPSRWVWAASRGAVPGGASAGRALARRAGPSGRRRKLPVPVLVPVRSPPRGMTCARKYFQHIGTFPRSRCPHHC